MEAGGAAPPPEPTGKPPTAPHQAACVGCFRSKARCDRAQPSCGRCTRLQMVCVARIAKPGRPMKVPPPQLRHPDANSGSGLDSGEGPRPPPANIGHHQHHQPWQQQPPPSGGAAPAMFAPVMQFYRPPPMPPPPLHPVPSSGGGGGGGYRPSPAMVAGPTGPGPHALQQQQQQHGGGGPTAPSPTPPQYQFPPPSSPEGVVDEWSAVCSLFGQDEPWASDGGGSESAFAMEMRQGGGMEGQGMGLGGAGGEGGEDEEEEEGEEEGEEEEEEGEAGRKGGQPSEQQLMEMSSSWSETGPVAAPPPRPQAYEQHGGQGLAGSAPRGMGAAIRSLPPPQAFSQPLPPPPPHHSPATSGMRPPPRHQPPPPQQQHYASGPSEDQPPQHLQHDTTITSSAPTNQQGQQQQDEAAMATGFQLVSQLLQQPPGCIDVPRARAVLLSWHWTSLLLKRDTTHGLASPLVQALGLQLPTRLPSNTQPSGSEAGTQEAVLSHYVDPLLRLSPEKAMCCVKWSKGKVSILASDRFASVFMQKDVIDDNIIKHGLLPLLLWTRLIQPDSLHGYWKLVLQAAFEAKAGGGEGGRGAAAPAVCLQVRDRFGLCSWATCRVGLYASPCGWYSVTSIVLEP